MVYDGVGRMKLWKKICIIFSVIVITFITLFFVGNDYQMTEKRVTIPTTDGKLSAVITAPKHDKPKGIIVFVHGDGAQDATQDGGYKPLMERFAKQGYMSVSWDKLGVGKSSGNWLNQTMTDRAKEVDQVVKWMKTNYSGSSKNIGLWGASQAGWVIPKVMNLNKDIRFSIMVAPAINWMRQGEYNTAWQQKDSGGTKQEISKAKQNFIADSILIANNKTYDEYKQNGGQEILSPDRYAFIRKNMDQDAKKDISEIQAKIYLVLAENDKNVDTLETKEIYSQEINPDNLEVETIPNVHHQMINPTIADSDLLVNLVGLMLPKYFLVDNNYLDYCEQVISKQ